MIQNLSGKLLLATPSMADHFFQDSVVLLCHHDDEGSMGLVLNHTQDVSVFDVLDDMGLCGEPRARGLAQMRFEEQAVFEAGPVDSFRGFVLHDDHVVYDSTMRVGDGLYLTTSKDVLEDLAGGGGPQRFLLLLGYAGWEAGQLENELIANDWLLAESSHTLLFNTPCEHRWALGARSIGFERSQLTSQIGHA
ncbi:MAG: YqgE/AlgH family protein [Mariprofundaceae bacterium]|nr:YqgE/AlgH family protein [Mariprofundaceae bacterium]